MKNLPTGAWVSTCGGQGAGGDPEERGTSTAQLFPARPQPLKPDFSAVSVCRSKCNFSSCWSGRAFSWDVQVVGAKRRRVGPADWQGGSTENKQESQNIGVESGSRVFKATKTLGFET